MKINIKQEFLKFVKRVLCRLNAFCFEQSAQISVEDALIHHCLNHVPFACRLIGSCLKESNSL